MELQEKLGNLQTSYFASKKQGSGFLSKFHLFGNCYTYIGILRATAKDHYKNVLNLEVHKWEGSNAACNLGSFIAHRWKLIKTF